MYAVIIAGGKQYRVEQNNSILIEKQEHEVGSKLEFKQVLLVSNGEQLFVGEPVVSNCIVNATVEAHGRHDKVKILKFKRRKHHMKHMGHRQWFTKVKIDSIDFH